jgi:hypothetical protein
MTVAIFGRVRHSGEIEQAALATLRLWLPTYLAEANEQADAFENGIAAPHSFGVVSEYARWPEESLPAVVLMAAGTNGSPYKDGETYYHAPYALEVVAEFAAADGATARLGAQLYGAAIRGCLLQRRGLGSEDDLLVTDWVAEELGTLAIEERATRVAVSNVFTVTMGEIAGTGFGPATPDVPDPMPTEWPSVESVTIAVDLEDPDE